MKVNIRFVSPIVKMLLMLIMALIMSYMPNISSAGEWTKKADMPIPRMLFGSAVVDGIVYCIGGLKGLAIASETSMDTYNPLKNTWEPKAKINEARCWFVANELNGKIYIMCGTPDGVNQMSSVEEYDPKINKWTFKKNIPNGTFAFSSAVLEGKIYVIGGAGNAPGIELNGVYAYDPISDTWQQKTNFPVQTDSASACAYNGKIYHMGGVINSNISSNVYEYEPAKDEWTQKTNMPTPRAGFSISIINGKIYAIGGHSPQGTVSVIDVYDPLQDKWIDQIQMTEGRSWHTSVVYQNKIYVMGGTHFYKGVGWPPQDVLSLVEEYTPDDWQFSVNPQDKITSTWSKIKVGN